MGLAPGLREGTASAFVTPRYRGVSLRTMGRMSADATRARTDACGVAGRVAGSEDGDPALERAWDLRQDHPTEFARAVGALPRSPAATLLRGRLAQARLARDDALRLSMEAERDIPDGTRWHARALEIIGNILVVLQQDDAAVSYLAAASDGYDRVGCQIRRSSSLQNRALLGFRTDREAHGGEEFVVRRLPRSEQADPRADATGLVRDLDAFRAVAACTQWRDDRGEPLAPVTVSVGVALITSPSLEPALLHADQTMYAAKRAGGDRVWTADGCPQPAVSPRR